VFTCLRVYGVTVCWPTSKRQRAYCILFILHIAYYIWFIRE
jgi:hypothetical protein